MSWQVTAKTIRCDAVENYATLLVYQDGSAKCSYWGKNSASKGGKKKLGNCTGESCPQLAEFKAWAFSH